MKRYNPSEIEPKWQKLWQENQSYKAIDFSDRPKFVILTEFPYPSGDQLHMGHMREYTLGDIIARYKRAKGMNVLFPMGFDAFGLPAENYAIKHKTTPQDAVEQNIANARAQLESMGYSIDWSRTFSTTDPEYYHWTQWLFLQFYKAGLAYQDEIAINWCPFCKTGLANEEVVNGRHERCENLVEKKTLKQWMLRITDYADRLIDGLADVDYPSRIADQQINWIGRSKGAEIDFKVDGKKDSIKIFTTRPDTIFGATFLVLAPEHPLVDAITTEEQKSKVDSYIKTAQSKSEVERQDTNREKTGIFTGSYAISPATEEEIPIWIADYVLMDYGTGAIMAVPAHDERDNEFAEKFDLPIAPVIARSFGSPHENEKAVDGAVVVAYNPHEDKYLAITTKTGNLKHRLPSGGIDNNETHEECARRELKEETGYEAEELIPIGGPIAAHYYNSTKDSYRRATTEAFLTVVDKDNNKTSPVRESHELDFENEWLDFDELYNSMLHNKPDTDHWIHVLDMAKRRVENDFKAVQSDKVFAGAGKMINSGKFDGMSSIEAGKEITEWLEEKGVAKTKVQYKLRDWIFSRQHYWGEPIPIIHCPEHGAVAVPDDQLPVKLPIVDHYEPTDDGKSPLSLIDSWVNTTCPKCGGPAKRETDTMPNWAGSNWYYLRYYDAHNDKAFADPKKLEYWKDVDLYLGGMEHTTLHLLYSRFHHQFLYDQGLVPTPEPYVARRGQGIILATDGTKMSKSKGNVVNPTQIIESGYGADALRLAITFLAPYDQTTPWSPESVAGCYRFLGRVWDLAYLIKDNSGDSSEEALRAIHKAIKKVSEDTENMNYNTAIAGMMESLNLLNKIGADNIASTDFSKYVQILAPYAPHISAELFKILGNNETIEEATWPEYEEKYLETDDMVIAVQVNGKLRGEVKVNKSAKEDEIKELAFKLENVQNFVGNKKPARVIYVPGKIINIVV